jgi:hypothetical protein
MNKHVKELFKGGLTSAKPCARYEKKKRKVNLELAFPSFEARAVALAKELPEFRVKSYIRCMLYA